MHESQQKLGARLLRDRRLGAAALVRVQRRPARGVRRRGDAARARVGLALVEPDHQRRAPADARGRRRHRPDGVPDLRHRPGPGALDSVQQTCVAQCDVAVGKVDLHAGARRQRRLPLRPDRDAARRRPLPRRHRRRARHGRPQVVRRPPGRRTPTLTDRTDEISTIGLWGPRARDILASLTDDDVSRRGLRVPHLPRDRRSSGVDACSPRGSPTSASSAGSSTSPMDDAAQLWEALLDAGDDHGAVPVGIGVYGTTGRIEKGYRAFGYELDAERTIVEAGMQRPKVKAADFVGREAYLAQRERGAEDGAVHADRRGPHLGVRREALHARRRADPDPRRRHADRRPRPPPLRHHAPGRRRRWASTCCWPTCRRRRRAIGNELAVSYMEELYPVDRRLGRRDAAARPGQRADALMAQRPGLHQAGARTPPARCVLTEDAQAVDGRYAGFTMSPHEECAVELAVQVAAATGGAGDGADARRRRRGRAAALRARGRLHRGALVEADAVDVRPGRRGPRDRRGGPRPRGRGHVATTWCCSATTPPTPATSRSASGSPTSSAGRSSTASSVVAVDGRRRSTARVDGPGRRRDLPGAAAGRGDVLEGGVEPRYPTRPGPDEGQEGRGRGARADRASRPGRGRVRLTLPPPAPSQRARCSARARRPRRAVVDLLREAGGAAPMILVLVETDADGASSRCPSRR